MTDDNIETAVKTADTALQADVTAVKSDISTETNSAETVVDAVKADVATETTAVEAKFTTVADLAKQDADKALAAATGSALDAITHIESSGVISSELTAAKNFLERAVSWIEAHAKAIEAAV
jgi:hypothetical protein